MTKATTNNQAPDAIRVVLPKKGRLKQDFAKILDTADLQAEQAGNRLDYGTLKDDRGEVLPIEFLDQRATDAIDNLDLGIADMAIVGLDIYEEKRCEAALRGEELNTRIVTAFNASACGLFIAAPKALNIQDPEDLQGKRIATSYPNTLRKWLNDNNIDGVKIVARDGGIEDYVRLGVADMVCDVVDTGGTLKANGLIPSLKLFDSTAVLIQRKGQWSDAQAEAATQLQKRLVSADGIANKEGTSQPQTQVAVPALAL
jgi:ATP phosphoribosyltransferase